MMNDDSAPRRAYFASLSTPDLIVCATVERARYDAGDLDLIRQELVRRGINVDRLAVPTAPFGDVLGVTPAAFATPLPNAWEWWSEGWQVFSRHLGFLAALAAVFTLPVWIIDQALAGAHDRDLSLGFIAHILFFVAVDALVAASVFNGLHRRMSQGSGSVGLAVAQGIVCWGRAFRETLKAFTLAFGASIFLFALGTTKGEPGLKVLAWFLAVYPGSYLLLRVLWVQPLAICKQGERNLFALSRRYSRNRTLNLYWFLHLTIAALLLGLLGETILRALLPGPVLEPAAVHFFSLGVQILVKTTLLVGYYHVSAHPDAGGRPVEGEALPPPPGLSSQG